MQIPWTERKSNQSILKEINPEYSLGRIDAEAPILGHLMVRADSLEKTPLLEKTGRRGRQRTRWQDGITDSMDMSLSKHQQVAKEMDAWRASVPGVAESDMSKQLNNNSEPTKDNMLSRKKWQGNWKNKENPGTLPRGSYQ